MARITDTPPPPSEMSSVVACFGSQSFTLAEHKTLLIEAKRLFAGYDPAGGYNQTETGVAFLQL